MIGIKPAILNTIAAHLKITFDLNIRKLRIIAPPDLAMCSKMFENRRDSRVFGLVVMAYDRDRNTLVAGLNDGFHAVAELGDDVELEQGVL